MVSTVDVEHVNMLIIRKILLKYYNEIYCISFKYF
jgi:hypothetical protein